MALLAISELSIPGADDWRISMAFLAMRELSVLGVDFPRRISSMGLEGPPGAVPCCCPSNDITAAFSIASSLVDRSLASIFSRKSSFSLELSDSSFEISSAEFVNADKI